MSRIGKQPIPVPSGVDVEVRSGQVQVKGPNGQLQVPVLLAHQEGQVLADLRVGVQRPNDRKTRAMWGLTRALLANAVLGVSTGFEKRLVLVGIGYRVDLKGTNLDMQLGFSHPVSVPAPPGIEFVLEGPPQGIDGAQATVVIKGADKELVGRTAANIRKIRPVEPYKGKGLRYSDEFVRRKAGKAST